MNPHADLPPSVQPEPHRTGEDSLSADRWQMLFDAMSNGVALIDREHRVLQCNRTLCTLIGKPPGEIIGRNCHQLLHLSGRTPAELPAGPTARDLRRESWVTALGEGWFEVVVDPVVDGAGHVDSFILVTTDITRHRNAEDSFRETETRLKKVLEVATVGVMFWDLSTGTLVDANDTFLTMMGYSRDEMNDGALTWQRLTPPEFIDVSLEEVAKFRRTGRVGPYEKEYLRKDGSRQWFVFAGSALGPDSCVEFCVDIGTRKKVEAALRESEHALRTAHAQLRRFVDANIVGVVIADTEGGIVEANDYYLRLIGFTREECEQGKVDWRAITPPEWLPVDEQAIVELRERGVCRPYEKEYLRRDGSRVAVYIADAMLPGNRERIVAFVLDITERKSAEAQIAMSLQEKEILLREVHHRVKNNLQIISSLLQLQSNEVDDPGALEKLRESQSRIHSMALIHERLYQSQNFASIAMDGYVRSLASSLVRSYSATGVRLRVEVGDLRLPLDQAVPCALILNELLTNAFKYGAHTPGQGDVIVRMATDADGMVILSVGDNGPGFSPEFDLQTTSSFGLVLVKMLTDQIGGRIAVTGTGGAMVSVTFPPHPIRERYAVTHDMSAVPHTAPTVHRNG